MWSLPATATGLRYRIEPRTPSRDTAIASPDARCALQPALWMSTSGLVRRDREPLHAANRQGGSETGNSSRQSIPVITADRIGRRPQPIRSHLRATTIGIGGRLATPHLPHHRTYGSVYGGSPD